MSAHPSGVTTACAIEARFSERDARIRGIMVLGSTNMFDIVVRAVHRSPVCETELRVLCVSGVLGSAPP